jgi:cellulase
MTTQSQALRMQKSKLVLPFKYNGQTGTTFTIPSSKHHYSNIFQRPESHHGPVIDYLAPCQPDCLSASPTSLKFTKIAESGLLTPGSPASQKWATDALHKTNNTWTVKIPSSLKAGNYVLRNEIIALHTAGTVGGAQNYPQCFNLKVVGDGSVSLPQGVVATSFYRPETKGIVFNIAANVGAYVVPGPPLWKGS